VSASLPGVAQRSRPSAAAPGVGPGVNIFLRSLLFLLGQALFTLVFAPVALLALLLPYRVRYRLVTPWAHLNLWWLAKTCNLTHEVTGLQNIPDTPCVVLAKHQSAWETLCLLKYFSPQTWVLKRELTWIPFFGWGLATMRPIAINRGSGKQAMQRILVQGQQRLADGIWIVIFPEGTRVAPGKRGRYRLGGVRLAAEAGCAVVPVAHNSGDFWPRNSFYKYPGVISLVIGPALNPAGCGPAEMGQQVEDWIENTVAGLRTPYSGDHFPQTPADRGKGQT